VLLEDRLDRPESVAATLSTSFPFRDAAAVVGGELSISLPWVLQRVGKLL
jgi:hypothetical protein